jgi:hypothetical protein
VLGQVSDIFFVYLVGISVMIILRRREVMLLGLASALEGGFWKIAAADSDDTIALPMTRRRVAAHTADKKMQRMLIEKLRQWRLLRLDLNMRGERPVLAIWSLLRLKTSRLEPQFLATVLRTSAPTARRWEITSHPPKTRCGSVSKNTNSK